MTTSTKTSSEPQASETKSAASELEAILQLQSEKSPGLKAKQRLLIEALRKSMSSEPQAGSTSSEPSEPPQLPPAKK